MVRHAVHGVRRVGRYLSLVGATVILLAQVLIGSVGFSPKAAALTSCTVSSLSPHQAPDGSQTGFLFTITSSTDSIAWIQVTSPSANLSIANATSDWLPTVTFTSSTATFSGTAISPNNPIQVNIAANVTYFPASNWTVQAADNSSGTNPLTCSGDTSISVYNNNPPNILSISANASTRSAVITWATDKPTTSEVDYGTTIAYGGVLTDATYVTSHSMTITGLTPATSYHYQVAGTDQQSNTVTSVDSTFFTAAEPVNTTTSGGSQPVNPPVTKPQDKVPPTIAFTSTPPRIVNTEPTFAGTATDDVAVTKIEYSIDNGKDWSSVDKATGLNTKNAKFSFTPVNLDDNTYLILARAIDAGGNTAQTGVVSVVVDRRPPIVGGMVLALGPQVIMPDKQGVITLLPGVDTSLTLSTTGGITSAEIRVTTANSKATTPAATYTLHQSSDNGLWTGTVSFSKSGVYILTAHAMDGADNITDRVMATVVINRSGNIVSNDGPVRGATVTAYCLDPDTGSWVVWDGQPYGQHNPQTTDTHGSFELLLPAGKYYLHASANGFRSINSDSFTLSQPTPVALALTLRRPVGIGSIHLPGIFAFETEPARFYKPALSVTATSGPQSLISTTLPTLNLPNTAGKTENSISWLGKPTVLTLLSTWDPATTEQLDDLQKLSANSDINVKVVGIQEGAARLRAFNAIDNSTLPWLADRYGEVATPLQVSNVPTHYFIDRKGVIRSISYGVLSYDQLVQNVSNMP